MNQTARLTGVLGATCLLAGVVLAAGNLVTAVPRKMAETRERQRHLRAILPEFRNDPTSDALRFPARSRDGQDAGSVSFYLARDAAADGRLHAIAAEATSTRGYGGGVTVLAGLKPDGTIMQIIVTRHAETPGLGTRATDRVLTRYLWHAFRPRQDSGLPPSEYLDQYNDRAATDLAADDFRVVKTPGELNAKTVQAVSGATVSSKAVAAAVRLIGTAYTEHQAEFPSP
jgi:Na+-translocating ferredoxin:NAD+ oxidoreductase subunit G